MLLTAAVALPCRADDSHLPILPLRFGSWVLQTPQELASGDLAGPLGQNFAVLVESGLTGAERATYHHASGDPAVAMQATLLRMRDASGAYGAYTFLRTPDMDSSDLTEKSAIGRNRILAVVGNLLLDLSGPGAASLAELKSLVLLLGQQTSGGVYPTLWQFLPGAGFERTSDRYLLGPAGLAQAISIPPGSGDWLGFAQGAEAEAARYHRGGEELTLLLAIYPTPQLARERMKELQKQLSVKSLDPDAAVASETAREPSAGATLYAERRGLMILLVSGAHQAQTARALFDHVDYGTDVTWNQPSWTAKEPPFLSMIADILVATCLLVLYAFVAGLVFAGIRLLVKIWKPGQVFDRDQDVEVLQLGLGSKPIEAKDFLTIGTRK
ncbi:MAG TPA: DUF6599 family protein [Candidatus Binatia bacterium]|nr:DUF6599 family protein [Candidatus Binatia bacterium]